MKYSLAIASLVTLAAPSISNGQELDSTDYFPLQGGNTWTYYDVLEIPMQPPDTSITGTFTIADSLTVSDTLYFKVPHPHPFADTLRSDSSRVYARIEGRDVLLFDFGAADSASYVLDDGDSGITYHVLVERDIKVSVAAGDFENCIRFTFDDPAVLDETRSYTFAPGVGVVSSWTAWETNYLLNAVVNDVTKTSIEAENRVPVAEDAYAWPNPFATTTTFSFPRGDDYSPEVIVYDLLGRRVDVLRDAECRGDRCLYTWAPRGFGSGLYFARMKAHRGPVTARVMIQR